MSRAFITPLSYRHPERSEGSLDSVNYQCSPGLFRGKLVASVQLTGTLGIHRYAQDDRRLWKSIAVLALLSASPLLHAQQMPGMDMPGMPMNHDTPSKSQPPAKQVAPQRDVQHLQEAENPALHTGTDLPAPELLHDAMQRQPLTLQQFQDWAEVGNPTLKQAAAAQERSRQQARQAALPPNPTVGYSGDHIRGGQYHGGEEGAFVQQTVVLGGKLHLRREVYQQEAVANGIGLEEQRIRVRADVQTAFYDALAAQRTVAVQQQLMQLAAESVQATHQLANLGQADAPDILQSEVEREQAVIDYQDAQRNYLQRFALLATAANQPGLPASPLEGDLEQVPDLDADATVAQVLTDSPSLRRAEAEVAVANAQLKQQKREPVPDLQVQAGEWYSGERLDGVTKAAGWMSFAQASVELPLWNRNQGGKAAAAADVSRAQAEVTRTQLSLRQQAEPLAQAYLSARFQAERYRTQLLPRAERAFELYSMKYQQMAAAYPQVLLSQRTLFTLQIRYLQALEAEWTSAIRLQHHTLGGGLDRMGSADDRFGTTSFAADSNAQGAAMPMHIQGGE